jgi:hypothetical protein
MIGAKAQPPVAEGEIHARDCESIDPRVKVFAILGMVGQSQDDIPIDYSHPVSEVAKQAFKELVSMSNGLKALIFSQNPNREQGMPSWAPNFAPRSARNRLA